jgi:hypothetical protein
VRAGQQHVSDAAAAAGDWELMLCWGLCVVATVARYPGTDRTRHRDDT